jgi:leucyl aminopeptidase
LNRDLLSKSNNWRDDLPPVFSWIRSVTIKTQDSFSGSVVVVATRTAGGKSDAFELDAKLEQAAQAKIVAALRGLGWNGKGAPCRVAVDGVTYLAVPFAGPSIHPSQKGRQIGIDAATAAADYSAANLCFTETSEGLGLDMIEGFLISQYSPGIFRTAPTSPFPNGVGLFGATHSAQRYEDVRNVAEAGIFMRFLQDCPPNWLNPVMFARIAQDISKDLGVKCTVLGPEEMQEHGMGAFLAVSRGSNIPPQLIAIEIPGQNSDKTVALVGKGLTFDAGGISIKPSAGMEEMKYDMSGGAAVLASAMVLAKQRPRHRVVCLIGAVENLLSGNATRPSDIVRTMSGKTVEIQNTDAEGRLVLCDVMTYAKKFYNPSLMVDIATLTGAVIFALGHFGSAVLTPDDKVAELVTGAANGRGEPIWRLPLWPEVPKEVKSEFADFANIPKPNVKAGTIMGGAFLREFAGDTPWAHLDVAGAAWSCMATGFPKSGGSTYGVRTLVEICHRFEG